MIEKSLCEIESDRHYLAMGYSSLFEFATRELGYSAGAAFRRILSMLSLSTRECERKLAELLPETAVLQAHSESSTRPTRCSQTDRLAP